MERVFVIAGAIIMFIAVGAGAFGAHSLSPYFADHPNLDANYQTAVRYMMIHGLGLIGIAWASTRWPGILTNTAGYAFIAGIVIFSGSLFLMSLTGIRWLGAITPIGGVAFLSGWLLLFIAAWRG